MPVHRVLVVEDDRLTAKLLRDGLICAGYAVVGPAYSLAQGKALADSRLSAAVIDFNLGHGETAESLAWMLDGLGVPLIVFTGAANKARGAIPKTARLIEKGCGIREVLASVAEVCLPLAQAR